MIYRYIGARLYSHMRILIRDGHNAFSYAHILQLVLSFTCDNDPSSCPNIVGSSLVIFA